MKKFPQLSEQAIEQLKSHYKNGNTHRVRTRSQIILLTNDGKTVCELVQIFKFTIKTIYSIINNYIKRGINGLFDNQRSGRPNSLTEEEKRLVFEMVAKDSRDLNKILRELKNKFNKTICKQTLIRFLKKNKYVWKRYRKSLKKKRNNAEFAFCKNFLNVLFKCEDEGSIDLYFFDESSFNLVPSVPYGWIPKNESNELPSSKSKNLNVLGFINRANDLHSYTCKGTVNSDVVIACFDDFVTNITKQTFVVIDNAPVHTSAKFQAKLKEWNKKGLFICNLPTYSPELNIIEILWKFIKYKWINYDAYHSYQGLVEEVENILKNVGEKYVIAFKSSFN